MPGYRRRRRIAARGDAILRRAGYALGPAYRARRRAYIGKKRTRPSALRHRRAVRQRRRFMRRTRRAGMSLRLTGRPSGADFFNKENRRVRFKCSAIYNIELQATAEGSTRRIILFPMTISELIAYEGTPGQANICPRVPSFWHFMRNWGNFEVCGMKMSIHALPEFNSGMNFTGAIAGSGRLKWNQTGLSYSLAQQLRRKITQDPTKTWVVAGYTPYSCAEEAKEDPTYRAEGPLLSGLMTDRLTVNHRRPFFKRYVRIPTLRQMQSVTPDAVSVLNAALPNEITYSDTFPNSTPPVVRPENATMDYLMTYVADAVSFTQSDIVQSIAQYSRYRVRKTWYVEASNHIEKRVCTWPVWERPRRMATFVVDSGPYNPPACTTCPGFTEPETVCQAPPECPPGEWPIFSGTNPPGDCWTCAAPPPPSSACATACEGETEVLCGVSLAGAANPCPPGETFEAVTSLAAPPCTAEVTNGRYLGTCVPII